MAYPEWWTCHTTFWNPSDTSQVVFTWDANLYTIWALLYYPGCLRPVMCSLSEEILLTFTHFILLCIIIKNKRVSICSFLCIKLSLTLFAYLHFSRQLAIFCIHSFPLLCVTLSQKSTRNQLSRCLQSMWLGRGCTQLHRRNMCPQRVWGQCIPLAPQRLLQGCKHDSSWSI